MYNVIRTSQTKKSEPSTWKRHKKKEDTKAVVRASINHQNIENKNTFYKKNLNQRLP